MSKRRNQENSRHRKPRPTLAERDPLNPVILINWTPAHDALRDRLLESITRRQADMGNVFYPRYAGTKDDPRLPVLVGEALRHTLANRSRITDAKWNRLAAAYEQMRNTSPGEVINFKLAPEAVICLNQLVEIAGLVELQPRIYGGANRQFICFAAMSWAADYPAPEA